MKLNPDEVLIVGRWEYYPGHIVPDGNCTRIKRLISDVLEKLAASEDGWDTLFRDPTDGRYWELTYPQSEMHGGGPPRLSLLSLEEVRAKYNF